MQSVTYRHWPYTAYYIHNRKVSKGMRVVNEEATENTLVQNQPPVRYAQEYEVGKTRR